MRHTTVLLSLGLMACSSGGAAEPASAESEGGENGGYPPAFTDCGGVWIGEGVQEEGGPWTIELTLSPPGGPGHCGTIEYPSLGCGGEVVDCAAEADGSVTMREVYSHGFESCAPAGLLRVMCGELGTASEGHMSWVWSGEGGPVSTELTRR